MYAIVGKTKENTTLFMTGVNPIVIDFQRAKEWHLIRFDPDSMRVLTDPFLWFLSLCKRVARAYRAVRSPRMLRLRELTGVPLDPFRHPEVRTWLAVTGGPPVAFSVEQVTVATFLNGLQPRLSRTSQR